MTDNSNWLGPNELDQISTLCKIMTAFYESVSSLNTYVSVEGIWDDFHPLVYDCNGDTLGMIAFAENGGFAFYPWGTE